MKRFLTILLSVTTILSLWAVEPTEDMRQKASNYYAYPLERSEVPELTPAPKGYEPFHIEHYGRHGSRWHIGQKAYNKPVEILEIAERNKQLTPRGEELLAQLRELQQAAIGRDGELSPLGAIQHRGIARRMVHNFPEVFADSGYVTARSSTVVRCILSMDNELQEMLAYNPALRITSDASEADMDYIARNDTTGMEPGAWYRTSQKIEQLMRDYSKEHPDSYDFIDVIIKYPQFARDSLPVANLFHYLYNVAANAQSLDRSQFPNFAPYDIFTPEEMENRWRTQNTRWFLRAGNSQLTEGIRPMAQSHLLRNIIESADSAMTSPNHGANLRFGHEVILLPLTVLLDLDGYGVEINDLDGIEQIWRDYEIFPMGSNIQLIFYRPEGSTNPDDVLVKALLNEREVTLPATPVTGPYYRWTDLRKHYMDKISAKTH